MPDNTNQYSGAGQSSSQSSVSASRSSSSSGNGSPVPASVQQYLLSQTDCETLFQAEPVSSLDVYLLDRCSGDNLLKVPSESMSDAGVTFQYNFDGDVLTSASIANDYYRTTNATVDISFTLRWHQVADAIKSLILPGNTEPAGNQVKHTISRRIVRRRPRSFILLAVAEGVTPDPSTAEDGALLFPNVSLDYANGFSLNYNPTDPLELEVNLTARFTRGVEGVLAVMWY